jgi:hypothetical protein
VAASLPDPKTAEFRRNLEDYIRAVQSGQQFDLYHYKTRIGRIGLPANMPAKLRAKAQEISFMEARDSSSIIRTSMMKEQAVVITKPARGPNTVPARGRRNAVARDKKQVAAVWPLPEAAAMSAALGDVRQLADLVREWNARFPTIAAVIDKFELVKELEAEIERRRHVLDNLEETAKRHGVGW